MGEWADYWDDGSFFEPVEYVDNRITLNGQLVTVEEVDDLHRRDAAPPAGGAP